MKSFAAVILVSAGFLHAEDFVTGQGARAVVGQDSFTRQIPGLSERLLSAPGGIAIAGNTLFVVDSSRVASLQQNNRVLIFPNINQQLPAAKASIPWDGAQRCPVCGGSATVVLGQPDFVSNNIGLTATTMRNPTAVASDGNVVAVADTDNNRVLIWNSIPTQNGQAADVVVGQANFTSSGINFGGAGSTPSAKGLRSPQGVWIQDGRLYIADTMNNRVVVFNSIPRSNGATADLVIGAPNFTTFVQSDLAQATLHATATNMLSPVAVTSDGRRLIVTDLGHNRVLIWNSIPTQNGQPVDVVVGQPDVDSNTANTAYLANNVIQLCASTGLDSTGSPLYPALCGRTLNFPRFAISDGNRLFIADGGNDRVLVFNNVPTLNAQAADVILGQLNDQLNNDSDPSKIAAVDSFLTPSALAWDGTNLYIADPFNRRVVLYTPGDFVLPITGVRNAASRDIFAIAAITFTSAPKENDQITLMINTASYVYKATKDDTLDTVIQALVDAVNANGGDPNVLAHANVVAGQVVLTSRVGGDAGNAITWSLTFSDNAGITASATSGNLSGGQNAAQIAPGTVISILGDNLADQTVTAPVGTRDLPQTLGGVEVYIDGIRSPLMFVSPTEIRSQMPWESSDATSVSVYVRRVVGGNRVLITNPIGVPIVPQNPGIFAMDGTDPRPARAFHASSKAFGVVSVDGSIVAGDIATVTIEDRSYKYTVVDGDTLFTVRDNLINQINNDPKVVASPASLFTRIVLQARVGGPEGEGIVYSASAQDGASIILTALTPNLCCASREGDPVTDEDPARPGELISVFATGLGFVGPDEALFNQVTGSAYAGPADNYPNSPVDDAQVGSKTANVIYARLVPGLVGVYSVSMQLNSDIPTNPQTQMWIAQLGYISNVVTIPVVNPTPQ